MRCSKVDRPGSNPNDFNHPLVDFLNMTVPLVILELEKSGGPNAQQWNKAREFGQQLAEKGDQILFKSKEAGVLSGKLAEAVAVLSFCPGGIKLMGTHYEGKSEE